MADTARAAVFVLPTSVAGQQGPVAAWTSTAGWAAAARRVLGAAWIVTPNGEVEPEAARRGGSGAQLRSADAPGWRRRVPTVAKTAAKDVRQYQRGRRFRLDAAQYRGRELAFVWQRHELFHTAGVDLARELGVPSVLFVPATHVWEAAQWGTRRPGWRGVAERAGEAPALRAADVVACGTEVVAEQARRIGARPESILITPTGVDLDAFAVGPDADEIRTVGRGRLGLQGRFVVGWVGSFRRFHAIDQAITALAGIDDATLLLIGDGPERARIEDLARVQGVDTVFTGTVSHLDLPRHLAAMDVALVLAAPDQTFHYSPLKLAEYLAAARAVVAPDVPQIAARLTNGVDACLIPPGDAAALGQVLRRLHDEPETRARLAAAARVAADARFSWDHVIREILDRLDGTRP